jgi:hypothetical protein
MYRPLIIIQQVVGQPNRHFLRFHFENRLLSKIICLLERKPLLKNKIHLNVKIDK